MEILQSQIRNHDLSKVLFPKRSVKMIDGSEKRNRRLAFELQISQVCEKRSEKKSTLFKDFVDFQKIIL